MASCSIIPTSEIERILAPNELRQGRLGTHTDFASAPPRRERNREFPAQRCVRLERLATARKVAADSRIADCLWKIQPHASVRVVQTADGRCGYAGVMRCGLRSCPNCSYYAGIRDYKRVVATARKYVDDGYILLQVPLTMRHKADEPLRDTRRAFTEAFRWMHTGRSWRRFVEKYGVVRICYGTEITDGGSGFHYHRHPLYAVPKPDWVRNGRTKRAFADQMRKEFWVLWEPALAKFGREALEEYGVRVTAAWGDTENPEKAAAYVTGLTLEATASMGKLGRNGNRSIWQLLDDAADESLSDAQRARARARYREVVEDMHGAHWFWVNGELEDEDAGGDEQEWYDDPGVVVLELSQWQWRCIRSQGKQLWLLELVECEGPDVAKEELARLCDSQRWSKSFRHRQDWWEENAGGQLIDDAAF